MRSLSIAVGLLGLGAVMAQDPAQGWLGYAQAICPKGTRITSISGSWYVGATPRDSGSFYSPWFGIDASDNLNLLQPVNPWLGNQWVIYNEYFQWQPEYNFNSDQQVVQAGDLLFGSITFNPNNESYTIFHSVTGSTSWSVSSNIAVQKDGRKGGFKNYTYAYVVYEKVTPCGDMPPDGNVTFFDMQLFCNDKQITNPGWTTAFVDDSCNTRAKVVDPATIEITWDTKAEDPAPEMIAASQATKSLGKRVPAKVAALRDE